MNAKPLADRVAASPEAARFALDPLTILAIVSAIVEAWRACRPKAFATPAAMSAAVGGERDRLSAMRTERCPPRVRLAIRRAGRKDRALQDALYVATVRAAAATAPAELAAMAGPPADEGGDDPPGV